MQSILGTTTLGDLKKKVMIPAFALDNGGQYGSWSARFFHNFRGSNSLDALAYKVGLYTSAAPTYFPDVDGYADGAMAANNPSLSAICLTQDTNIVVDNRPTLGDIVCLSIGSNEAGKVLVGGVRGWVKSPTLHVLTGKNKNRGWIKWAEPAVHIFLDSDNAVTTYQVQQILRDRHIRIEPKVPNKLVVGMDNASYVKQFAEFGNTVNLAPYLEQLNKWW